MNDKAEGMKIHWGSQNQTDPVAEWGGFWKQSEYSEDPNIAHSNNVTIRLTNYWKFGI